MANFRDPIGHNSMSILSAVIASGVYIALIAGNNGYIYSNVINILMVFVCVYLAGIAPDIDSKTSIPNRNLKYLSFAVLVGLSAFNYLSIDRYLMMLGILANDELLVLGILIKAVALYFWWMIFDLIVEHRGHFHSIFAAFCFALFFAFLAKKLTDNELALQVIFTSSFLSYCGHLLLDDLTTRTKRKALRLFSRSSNQLELFILIAIPASVLITTL